MKSFQQIKQSSDQVILYKIVNKTNPFCLSLIDSCFCMATIKKDERTRGRKHIEEEKEMISIQQRHAEAAMIALSCQPNSKQPLSSVSL